MGIFEYTAVSMLSFWYCFKGIPHNLYPLDGDNDYCSGQSIISTTIVCLNISKGWTENVGSVIFLLQMCL